MQTPTACCVRPRRITSRLRKPDSGSDYTTSRICGKITTATAGRGSVGPDIAERRGTPGRFGIFGFCFRPGVFGYWGRKEQDRERWEPDRRPRARLRRRGPRLQRRGTSLAAARADRRPCSRHAALGVAGPLESTRMIAMRRFFHALRYRLVVGSWEIVPCPLCSANGWSVIHALSWEPVTAPPAPVGGQR